MPTKAELQEKVEHLTKMLDQFTNIDHARLVSFEGGQWGFQSPIFPAFVNTMAQMFEAVDAPNYIELQCAHATAGPIVLTIQKKRGKTPHELRDEARAEVERLRAALVIAQEACRANLLYACHKDEQILHRGFKAAEAALGPAAPSGEKE